jgi:hypothetical protein
MNGVFLGLEKDVVLRAIAIMGMDVSPQIAIQ